MKREEISKNIDNFRKTQDSGVKHTTISNLTELWFTFKEEHILDFFVEILEDRKEKEYYKLLALKALRRIVDESLTEIKKLSDSEKRIKTLCDVINNEILSIEYQNHELYSEAVAILKSLGELPIDFSMVLISLYSKTNDLSIKQGILELLFNQKQYEIVPFYRKSLANNDDEKLNTKLVEIISDYIKKEEYREELGDIAEELLDHPEDRVKQEIANLLNSYGCPGMAEKKIIKIIDSQERITKIRLLSALATVGSNVEETVYKLKHFMETGDNQISGNAKSALNGIIGREPGIETIKELFKSYEEEKGRKEVDMKTTNFIGFILSLAMAFSSIILNFFDPSQAIKIKVGISLISFFFLIVFVYIGINVYNWIVRWQKKKSKEEEKID